MSMKTEAMRAQAGSMLIGMENIAVEALGKLLETKQQLDSLKEQVAGNKYYTESDLMDVEAVEKSLVSNLNKVMSEYLKAEEKDEETPEEVKADNE